jgi:hypothetical protein
LFIVESVVCRINDAKAIFPFFLVLVGVHLTSSPDARPSARFTVGMEVKETIDLRAGDVEAA